MRQKALWIVLVFSLCDGLSLWAAAHRSERALRMQATAFSNWKRPTATGGATHEGVAAADPSVLPLGTIVRVRGAGRYSGT